LKGVISVNQIKEYIFGPCLGSEGSALAPPCGSLEIFKKYLSKYWLTSFCGFFALCVSYYSRDLIGHDYLYLAAKQAVSPLFWNMLFVLGAILILVSSLCDMLKIKSVAKAFSASSTRLFNMAADVGALMFGVLVGMFVVALSGGSISIWGMLGHSVLASILLAYSLFLNVFVWWFALCSESDNYKPAYLVYIESKPVLKLCFTLVSLIVLAVLVVNTEPHT
ncbi:TPA: hypothetical protein ACVOY5_004539, partial [Vibrio alginolyticus]